MNSEEAERTLSTHRRQRGVAKASITRLTTRLKDLESNTDQPAIADHARRMQLKLDALNLEFRTHHHHIFDFVTDKTTLSKEQETLDEHDDLIAELSVRVLQLINICTSSPHKVIPCKLLRIEKALSDIDAAITTVDGESNPCLLHQCEEQVGDLKKELSDARNELLTLGLDDSDDLVIKQGILEKAIFDCLVKIKKQLATFSGRGSPTPSSDNKGVRLPKLDVPTFDGNILNWRTFWEQFHISVHDRSNLSDSEKLVYLQHSLKNGSARSMIEGLSRSGDNYAEAVECLQSRYDCPCLIHQTHVRMILEAPTLKDGSGKELRRLYDIAQQHLRALKAMGHEPSGPIIQTFQSPTNTQSLTGTSVT